MERRVGLCATRVRLGHSFDQRAHTYLGYALKVRGSIGNDVREFLVSIGEGAHAKHKFRAGDTVSGEAQPVADPRLETIEFYKVSDLKVAKGKIEPRGTSSTVVWYSTTLVVYRERGHRRLAACTYEEKCQSCMWGCVMAVEMNNPLPIGCPPSCSTCGLRRRRCN